ncbi:TPA: hypothetical protein PR959_001623 [Staphylococcus aureus]|nr:hypothetical protein [Staphylococcus aureus]HDG4884472.1 hypothetical protein [Staphylococcus aureus]HDK3864944.1 hypothetical protein [Staphylococcus aureus]HEO8862716.1 hypothetical protein [Staphylococcus aureus]
MTTLTIYYIKNYKGEVVYTNTNSDEFAAHVNTHMELGLGKYTTYESLIGNVKDLEIGTKEVSVDL